MAVDVFCPTGSVETGPSLSQALQKHSKRPSARHASPDTPAAPRGLCCGLLPASRKAQPRFEQTLVVLRHSERADRVNPAYKDSPEARAWPHDCPITLAGVDLARSVADEMAELHESACFSVIACSPYRRCLETASEVAKRLGLRVLIDQEIGEVCDSSMPAEGGHRPPTALQELARGLGIASINPSQDDGGVKLFGKPPVHPETLEDAKRRFVCRIETYIHRSAETRQNFILVTHADAVAASLEIFERGFADIRNMDFCARLVAKRTVELAKGKAAGVYAEQWGVEFKGVDAQVNKPDTNMEKYFEKVHLENVVEVQAVALKRKDRRTKTDAMFDQTMMDLRKSNELQDLADLAEEEED